MRLPLLLLVLACLAVAACGGGNAASKIAEAPDYNPEGQTKCSVRRSQAEPLVVEWPPAERGRLEAAVHEGLVAVHYSGCEMELRPYCRVKSERYKYAPLTRKRDEVSIKDEDELYAQLPAGAARLEAKLKKAGELHVDMTLVGRWESESGRVSRDELDGDCDDATHVVSAVTVGAFTFTAGAQANVGGHGSGFGVSAGASSDAKREMLTQDGDESACATSTGRDSTPPDGCGALIRIEVAPIGDARRKSNEAAVVVPPPVPTTTAKPPHRWTPPPEPTETETAQPAPAPTPTPTEMPTVRTRPVDRTPEYPTAYGTPAYTANGAGPSTVSTGGRGTLGTIVGWGAIAALAAGSGFALLASGTASKEIGSNSTSNDCISDYHYCNQSGMSAHDTAHNEALAADILLGIGAVGAVVYWFLPIEMNAAPIRGGAAVSVGGKF
jgi:hypothetical protein